MKPLFLVALLILLEPATDKVQIDLQANPLIAGVEVDLIVVDPSDGEELFHRRVEVPWRGELSLGRPLSGLRLEVVSPTYWAAPLSISEDQPERVSAVELFPRGEVTFIEDLATSKEGAAPSSEKIVVEVSSAPVPREKDKLKKTRLDCRREGERWHCPAPALALDLRLEKERHVPRYVFGAKVEPGKTLDLGRIRFERGASISGFVTVEEGQPKGATVSVDVSGNWSAAESQRRELRKLEAVANERGFFQVTGVAPGGYRIEASRQGLTPTEIWPVDVLEGYETPLDEPLHLTRAAEIEIHLSPPLGPLGKSWKLLLIRELPGSKGSDQVFEGIADENGTYIGRDLRPGSYLIHILNPDGEKTGAGEDSIWTSRFLDLAPGSQPLYLDIPVIAIEGTFQAGDEPLEGRLIFGGFHGAPHVTLRSDEEGRFRGQLPREGDWELDVEVRGQLLSLEKVQVEPRGGRPARLAVRLPDTRFHGRVTHKGKPVEGASLWGLSREPGKPFRFDIDTDSEGHFDLEGLAPGRYGVTVSSARLRLGTPERFFEIPEGVENPPVEIELEEFLRIEGRVLASGVPVPMAGIGLFLRARQGEDTRQGQSDAAGVVRLLVPESTREIVVVAAPPGFAWQVMPLQPLIAEPGFAPFTVEVAQNGGTLRIDSRDGPSTRLVFAGVGIPVDLIRGTLRASGHLDPADPWIFPNAAPGAYQACAADRCVGGFLAPGGSLDLSLAPE